MKHYNYKKLFSLSWKPSKTKIAIAGSVLLPSLFALLVLGNIPDSYADKNKDGKVRHIIAVGKKALKILPTDPNKVNFDFGDIKAWVRDGGQWYIQGHVQHSRLRCANYRLGIQFGKGDFSCSQVSWLTQAVYVTNRKQCNSASVQHSGGDTDSKIPKVFAEINCAKALIQCDGACD